MVYYKSVSAIAGGGKTAVLLNTFSKGLARCSGSNWVFFPDPNWLCAPGANTTMKSGFCGCRPNERIATALVLEGNLGLRVSDILRLRPCDIVRDGDRYRLEIVERKTGKARVFTVPLVLQQYIENYCLRCGIERADLIFPITERAVQKHLALVCDYLGYERISTHSFRKWYATEIYKANGYDIALVQRLLQHSSAATTQRYIGIEPQRIEMAIEGHARLI